MYFSSAHPNTVRPCKATFRSCVKRAARRKWRRCCCRRRRRFWHRQRSDALTTLCGICLRGLLNAQSTPLSPLPLLKRCSHCRFSFTFGEVVDRAEPGAGEGADAGRDSGRTCLGIRIQFYAWHVPRRLPQSYCKQREEGQWVGYSCGGERAWQL